MNLETEFDLRSPWQQPREQSTSRADHLNMADLQEEFPCDKFQISEMSRTVQVRKMFLPHFCFNFNIKQVQKLLAWRHFECIKCKGLSGTTEYLNTGIRKQRWETWPTIDVRKGRRVTDLFLICESVSRHNQQRCLLCFMKTVIKLHEQVWYSISLFTEKLRQIFSWPNCWCLQ